MRRALILLALVACKREEDPSSTDTCADAVTLGAADASRVETFDIDWTWSADDGLSLGETRTFRLADDIAGLTVTVDAGDTPTGLALVRIGSRTWHHWKDGPSGRKGSGGGAAAVSDTGDTGGGGSSDTGGSAPPGDGWGAWPLYHLPGPAGSIALPVNEATEPSAGCLTLRAAGIGDLRGQPGTLHIATKRAGDTARTMDLNLVVADGAGIDDDTLDAAVARMAGLYAAGGGPEIGRVTRFDLPLPSGPYVHDDGPDLFAMRAAVADSGGEALNMFFIADFLGSAGTLGIAAGIPGPFVQGTAGSGVTLSVDAHRDGGGAIDVALLGETMAHEGGHQLGLFHTTEAEGTSFDPVEDTPECDAETHDGDGDGEVTAEECADADGLNFMFWVAGDQPQTGVTATQARVLVRSPLNHHAE